MSMWTEQAIAEHLAGTFTTFTPEGTAITINAASGPRRAIRQEPWTPAEDDILCRMKMRNYPWAEIAWTVGRNDEAVKKRYSVLRVKGRVMV